MNTCAENVDGENVRQRIAPDPSDLDYLHLSDLLLAISREIPADCKKVLDYGCGNSPYQRLFGDVEYRRADFISGDCDYQIDSESCIKEKDATFDVLLTTQVAEHVENPDSYFAECYRLLMTGGKLILSTHGSFEDHAAPFDFQRWTAAGLERDLRRAGFRNIRISKLTTQGRALLYFVMRYAHTVPVSRTTLIGGVFYILGVLMTRLRQRINIQADDAFHDSRVVSAAEGGHSFYVALLATAER